MSVGSNQPLSAMPNGVEHHEAQHSNQVFQTFSLPSIYTADPRPTLVVDISTVAPGGKPVIVYTNPALDASPHPLRCFRSALQIDTGFCAWALSTVEQRNYYRYGGSLWFGTLLPDRWKVISTVHSFSKTDPEPHLSPAPSGQPSSLLLSRSSSYSGHVNGSLEATVTRLKDEIRLGEYGREQAARQAQLCSEAVQRFKEELGALETGTSQTNLGRNASSESTSQLNSDSGAEETTPQKRPRVEVKEEVRVEHRTPSQQLRSTGTATSKVVFPLRTEGDAIALEKFQRLAEAVDVGFFELDPSGTLLYANDAWYALSGHPRDPKEHTDLSFRKCLYPDDIEFAMNQWEKLVKGQALTFEMRWKKAPLSSAGPDAPIGAQWVLSACAPIVGEDGEVKSICGCTTDISAQKQSVQVALQRAAALERARASEERFSRFAEVAPVAIFRFDKNKNIEYCNDRWFEMTGVPKTRFEDIAWPYGVHDDDVEMCSRIWGQSIEHHSLGQIEFRLQKEWHDDHNRRGQCWVYCSFFAEFSEDGTFSGMMGSLLDISHLKWAEITQKLRAEEALEAKRQQENFIDITSHEMRNPLSAIVQCADSIMTSLVDTTTIISRRGHLRTSEEDEILKDHIDTGIDAAQTILSCAAHQRRIVDDILTLSKLDSNLLLITPVQTDPIQMVQNVIKMFEMDSGKADVILTRKLDQSFRDLNVQWLMMDPSRVSQILINLLGNAIKFTRCETTRNVTIRMSVSLEPPSRNSGGIDYVPAESVTGNFGDAMEIDDENPIFLKIEVQDTGRGLTLEEKEKLFMRFSQASPKTHVQYGGSGLGLFISKKLTEMQGGEIGFASVADVGSTFAFYIKTRRTSPPIPEANLMAPQYGSDYASNTTKGMVKRPLNVLLVEDNLVNQKVLGKQLERQGCTVFVAGHGLEALDFLKTTELWSKKSLDGEITPASDSLSIDVVLMDTEMPVMGGLECTRRIRAFEEQFSTITHLPIISISANARQEQVNEAELAGVDDTITKPFRIKELMPMIHRLAGPHA